MSEPYLERLDDMVELAWSIICSSEPSPILNDEHVIEWQKAKNRLGDSWHAYLRRKYPDAGRSDA